MGEPPPRARRLAHAAAAALAGVLTFAIYLRTMYPGLVSFGDSPKMQFVGRIWGTPHNPGYPLFVVVSHLFGLVPIGTLAYRINLMSAVFGALACAIVTLAAARLTGRAWAGLAAGLALGFGRVFWSQAIVAEVYALATALLAAAIALTLRWTDTRRPRDLLAAVACAALAVGNHLTIVMAAPGLVVMVLATDWRRALRPRLLIAMTTVAIAGLAQYLLILFWTYRGAPYLETTAHSLGELVSAASGGQFHSWFGRLGWRELATVRMAYVGGTFAEELHPWGLALLIAGVVAVTRRRPAVAAGLVVSAACVWGFALDYDVRDPVFLLPVITIGWIFAAAGAAAIVDLAAARMPAVAAAAWALPIAGAAALLAANYRVNDHHARTYEMTLLNDVLLTVPTRAALVPATFADELMLGYKLFGERAADGRDLALVPATTAAVKGVWRAGRPVYAMSEVPADLAGNGFVFEPVPLFTVFKDGRREPFGGNPVLFRLTDVYECRDIANRGWVDLSDAADRRSVVARVDNYRPFDSQLWIVAGRATEHRSTLASFSGPGQPIARSLALAGADPAAVARALAETGAAPPPLPSSPVIDVLRVQVNDRGEFEMLTIDLGSTPRFLFALGTTDLQNPKRLRICSGDAPR